MNYSHFAMLYDFLELPFLCMAVGYDFKQFCSIHQCDIIWRVFAFLAKASHIGSWF